MEKITIKKVPFKLQGKAIEKGAKLSFKALDKDGNEVSTNDIKETKIISFFPDINTSVCDLQTVKIGSLAKDNPQMKFISVTVDDLDKINSWCEKKELNNLTIWSDDKFKEFQTKTNLYIPKIKKLSRGLIILDQDDVIVDMFLNKEIAQQPDWAILDKYL